jgi:hypothetical protein
MLAGTDLTERDGTCPIRQGHSTRERPPETAETHVVWLITLRLLAELRAVLPFHVEGDGVLASALDPAPGPR